MPPLLIRTDERLQERRGKGVSRLGTGAVFVLVLLLACILSGCLTLSPGTELGESGGDLSPVTPTPCGEGTLPISGITWELVAYDSGRIAQESVIPGSVVTARFEDEGIVHGNTGCNQYWARYEASFSRVSIEAPQRTNAVCNTPPGVHSQESLYLVDLGKAKTYSVEGDFLTLSDGNGRAMLLFRKETIPKGAAQIFQDTWYLTASRDDQGSIVMVPGGVLVTARFLEGRVFGFSGCNCYVAPASVRGAATRIESPLVTDTWCRNETVRNQERLFFSRMKEVDAYVPGDGSLILVNGRGETLLEFVNRC